MIFETNEKVIEQDMIPPKYKCKLDVTKKNDHHLLIRDRVEQYSSLKRKWIDKVIFDNCKKSVERLNRDQNAIPHNTNQRKEIIEIKKSWYHFWCRINNF